MFEKLAEVEDRYIELEKRLADPEIVKDQNDYKQVAKAHSSLSPLVAKWREYKSIREQIAQTEEMLKEHLDEEMKEMVQLEFDELRSKIPAIEDELRIMLLPSDPNDDKDVILEIRAGTGGEEAALFVADLFRMYTRFAEREGWKTELMNCVDTGIGGYREVVLAVKGKGKGAYSRLKFEGGVHRVQRVPSTESSGRIHTSAATVSVLPEADEIDVELNMEDVEIDTYRSAGAGGQNVQKTETAIRIIHKPTGIVVTCQDERSQLQNRLNALRVLRTQLYDRAVKEQRTELDAKRRLMVGSGDRSEKSRTYNFPQNRVTDHRIEYTSYNLPAFLDGDLDDMLNRLNAADQADKLKVEV